MSVFYNEFDANAAQWIRNLGASGEISQGVVDERSIKEVRGADIAGVRRAHFFAGIGGWDLALRLAGWPEDREVWTGSCPCQPYSSAGKQKGNADERNLWPDFFRLIKEQRPRFVCGEQVASADVIGRASSENEDVQEMRDREAVFRVLRQLKRESEESVQGLHDATGSGVQAPSSERSGKSLLGVAGQEARIRADEHGEIPGGKAGARFQPGPAEHSGSHREGGLRTDRNPVRPDEPKGMERPIPGSNRLIEGVHEGKCPSHPLLGERDGECLGCLEDFGDCVGDHGESTQSLERFIGQVRESTPEALEPVWVDGIRADLETAGYTFGTIVVGAHSVGANHIRQRLYWGAALKGLGNGNGIEADAERGVDERGRNAVGRSEQAVAERQARHDGIDGSSSALGLAQDPRGLRRRGRDVRRDDEGDTGELEPQGEVAGLGVGGGVSDEHKPGCKECRTSRIGVSAADSGSRSASQRNCTTCGLPNNNNKGQQERGQGRPEQNGSAESAGRSVEGELLVGSGPWKDFRIVLCTDGKARRTGSRVFPLAYGLPRGVGDGGTWRKGLARSASRARIGMLKGSGNAIVPELAAIFIRSFLETEAIVA